MTNNNTRTSWQNIKAVLSADITKEQVNNTLDSEFPHLGNVKEEVSNDFILARRRSLSREKEKFLKRVRCKISKYFYILHITVKSNNIFCILTDNKKKTICRARNSGSFGMKLSKKNLKHNLDFFIKQYKKLLVEKEITLTNTLAIKLNCSRKYRKTLLKTIESLFFSDSENKNALLIDIKQGKPFNGCRGIKLRRKKRFKPRNFKVIV